jgi:LPS-assembly lipoprotein
MKTQYLLVILLFTLSACGFHLRGSQQRAAAIVVSKVYVVNAGASTVTPIVKSQLAGAGATAVESIAKAEYTLTLEREYFEQTVLSVSATTGKVEEYQITLTLYMSVVDAKGVELLAGEPIRSVRDYTFDEDAVLGKFAEEQVLREELSRQAAAEILRRFNTATSSSK